MGFNVDPSSLKLFTPCICGELKAFQNDNIVSVKTLFEFQSFVDSKTDMGKVGIMPVLLEGIFKENCGLKWGGGAEENTHISHKNSYQPEA